MQTTLELLAITLSGAAAVAFVYVLYNWTVTYALNKRLIGIAGKDTAGTPAVSAGTKAANSATVGSVINILSRLSLPEEGWQSSAVQLKFLQAGIRNKNAPRYYFAVKTLLTVVLPALLGLFLYFFRPDVPLTQSMMLVLSIAAAGYYLPEMALRFITEKRVERMRDSLPDMIDLMVVCTESGMGIDSAIARISREMASRNPDLAQEFYLSVLEIRAGATRIEALRNLALRTNLKDINDLVTMFVQADKFGTGMAESLRVQSDMLRSRRTQRAEEMAAKIPVKMTIPLVLFIFPTLLMVLLGPAIIQMIEVFTK
jgi:tight adherence protein C